MREDKMSSGHLQISPGAWSGIHTQTSGTSSFSFGVKPKHSAGLTETQQASSWSARWQAGWCGWAGPGGVTIRPPRWPDKDSRPVRLNLTGHSAPMGSPLSTSDSPPPPDRLTWSHYHSPALSCHLHFYNFLAHFTQSTK